MVIKFGNLFKIVHEADVMYNVMYNRIVYNNNIMAGWLDGRMDVVVGWMVVVVGWMVVVVVVFIAPQKS